MIFNTAHVPKLDYMNTIGLLGRAEYFSTHPIDFTCTHTGQKIEIFKGSKLKINLK